MTESLSPTPVLSICMATLNRVRFIGETLDSLLAQAPAGMEIVILDGGSTDGTDALVATYIARHPGTIHYVRQDRPMGVDQDFDTAVQHARGTYCWLMSDDDLVKPGAVARVLREIGQGYDLIVVNAEVRTPDLSAVLVSKIMRMETDTRYTAADSDQLLRDAGSYLSFIGGVVMRRAVWNARAREPYFGSLFIHVGVIFQAPLSSVLVIADPLVEIRYGNALWTSRGFEIWLFKWPWLIWSFAGLSDAAKAAVSPREPWRKATTLMLFRARGAYALREYRRWLRAPSASWPVRLKLVAVALLPGPIVHLMVTWYIRFCHPSPAVALFELRHSPFHATQYLSRLTRLLPGRAR